MVKIEFYGWEVGARKIPFTTLLTDKGGLSLSEAKSIKDAIIDRDEIKVISVASKEKAARIVDEAVKIGIKCRVLE